MCVELFAAVHQVFEKKSEGFTYVAIPVERFLLQKKSVVMNFKFELDFHSLTDS
jgi:hypothetical protein